MPKTSYTVNNVAIVNLLGYTKKEKEAVDLSHEAMIAAGIKFADLFFDGDFKISMHNLDAREQQAVIDEITMEYNFCVRGV